MSGVVAAKADPEKPALLVHGRIIALDGFRGVLALLVLCHHLLLTQPDFANFEWSGGRAPAHGLFEWIFFYTPVRLFWLGQDRAWLFFVLSGYVLSLPWYKHRTRSYPRFLIERFCRIYPPYLIVMLLACAGAAVLDAGVLPGASIWFNQLGWSHKFTWRLVPSVLFLLNNSSGNWVNESVWSLAWEVRMYVIFPLLMFPLMRWGNKGVLLALAVLMFTQFGLAHLVPLVLSRHLGKPEAAFFYPVFFIFGAAVALNQARIRTIIQRATFGVGPMVFLLGLVVCWVHWPLRNAQIDGLAGALFIASIVGSATLQRGFEAGVLVWLGRVSYSLYLVHVPIILTAVALCHGRLPLAVCFALAPLCIGLAELFRRYVEIPSVACTHALFTRFAPRLHPAKLQPSRPQAEHNYAKR